MYLNLGLADTASVLHFYFSSRCIKYEMSIMSKWIPYVINLTVRDVRCCVLLVELAIQTLNCI